MQIGHRGAAAHPITLGELLVADTVLLRPVEVVGAPVPGLFGGPQDRIHQHMPEAPVARRAAPRPVKAS
jgi:hypothetical protein